MMLTKELKVQSLPGGRKLRVSSNLLRPLGFTPETRLSVKAQRGSLILSADPSGDLKVHERSYNAGRRPREAVIEISSQKAIDGLLPPGWDRVHWTFTPSSAVLRPVQPRLFWIRKQFREVDRLHAFMTLSSGIDARVFQDSGFSITATLDWRPPEARDAGRPDASETGVHTTVVNTPPRFVFNEDISTVDASRVASLLRSKVGPIATLSCGLQCDDHSQAKSAKLKQAEMAAFLPGARELGYYATKLIEEVQPASVFIENVPGWHGSESQAVLGAVLTRLGYFVQAKVLDAREFGAFTSRRRTYFVASIFPGFEFPEPTGANAVPLFEILQSEIPNMRDVSDKISVQKAKGTHWDRSVPLSSTTCPTVLKSQSRQTKDSLYFKDDAGRVLLPTVNALRSLHGIPDDFRMDHLTQELATEQIGQGVDFPLHGAVAAALRRHLLANSSRQILLNI